MSNDMDANHVHLREYIETILREREKALQLTAANLEHRLETLNALRNDVLKDRDLFLSKNVYHEMHTALLQRVEKIEVMQSRFVGVSIALVALSGACGAVIAHLLK